MNHRRHISYDMAKIWTNIIKGEQQFPTYSSASIICAEGAQWLSGRVLDSRPKGRRFEPHRRHCFVALERDTFILA